MRRMKIRATPNFGGGGSVPRLNQPKSKPPSDPVNQTKTEAADVHLPGEEDVNTKSPHLSRNIISEEAASTTVPEIILDSDVKTEKKETTHNVIGVPRVSRQPDIMPDCGAVGSKNENFQSMHTPLCSLENPNVDNLSCGLQKECNKDKISSVGELLSEPSPKIGMKGPQYLLDKVDATKCNIDKEGLAFSGSKSMVTEDHKLVSAAKISKSSPSLISDKSIVSSSVSEKEVMEIDVQASTSSNVGLQEKMDSSTSNIKKASSLPSGANIRRPKIYAKPSFLGAVGRKKQVQFKSESHSYDIKNKEVTLAVNNAATAATCGEEALSVPSGASIRKSKPLSNPFSLIEGGRRNQGQVEAESHTSDFERIEVTLDEESDSTDVNSGEKAPCTLSETNATSSTLSKPFSPTAGGRKAQSWEKGESHSFDSGTKEVTLDEEEGDSTTVPSETNIRRHEVLTKPPSFIARKRKSYTCDPESKIVTLDEGDDDLQVLNNSEKAETCISSRETEVLTVDTKNNSLSVTKSVEKPSLISNINIRRPKFQARPSLFGAVGKKNKSQVKAEASSSNMATEVLTLDEENNTTSVKTHVENPSVTSGNIMRPQIQPSTSNIDTEVLTLDEESNTSVTISVEKPSSLTSTVKIRRPKIQTKPSFLGSVGKKHQSQVKAESYSSDMERDVLTLDDEINSTSVETSTEKPSVTSVGNIRRPKIHAKPSFLGSVGKRSQSQVKGESCSPEKVSEILTLDQDSDLTSVTSVEKLSSVTNDFNTSKPKIHAEPLHVGEGGRKSIQVEAEIHNTDLGSKEFMTKEENKSTTTASVEIIPAGNNIRRSRIRAKPALFAKRKAPVVPLKGNAREEHMERSVGDGVADQVEATVLSEKVKEEKAVEKSKANSVSERSGSSVLEEVVQSSRKPPSNCDNTGDVKKVPSSNSNTNVNIKNSKSCISQYNRTNSESHRETNSDDSCGDKENSSKLLDSIKTMKRERLVKGKAKLSTYCRTKAKMNLSDVPIKKRPIKIEKDKLKSGASDDAESDDESEERKEKKIFRERKEKYRKKLSQGNMERGEMTMFDLIFWNPETNPMPGRIDSPKKKVNNSNRSETDDAASDVLEEQMVDDLGLDPKDNVPESSPNSPLPNNDVQVCDDASQSPKPISLSPKPISQSPKPTEAEEEENEVDNKEGSGVNMFAPQVKIGPNGQIILDEQSIKIQTTAAKNRDEILSKAEVVEESNDSAHYGKWSKKRRRSCEWTMKETARFYKALSTVGTDFSLMETLFNWRSRAELKTKFKKEERTNRELVDRALKDCTQFDLSLFDDESDYNPEEDRKASRIAERAEAKRKRLEMRQSQKEEEKRIKKLLVDEEKAKLKEHKAALRKMKKKLTAKRKVKKKRVTEEETDSEELGLPVSDTSDIEIVQNGQSDGVKRPQRRKRRPVKKKEAVQRKSTPSVVEISEVTVTMETIKLTDIREADLPVAELTINEMTVCENVELLHSPSAEMALAENFAHEMMVSPSETDADENFGSTKVCVSSFPSEEAISKDLNTEVAAITPQGTEGSEILPSTVSSDLTTDKETSVPAPEEKQKMWDFPISAIEINEHGKQIVRVPTATGHKSVPVPHLPLGTSNIVVVAMRLPESPGEYVYHVYTVSPLAS